MPRNPALTFPEFLNIARARLGAHAADLFADYPDEVEPFLGKITQRLLAKGWIGEGGRERGRERGKQSRWAELAALVPTVFADEPEGLRALLARGFMDEAGRVG